MPRKKIRSVGNSARSAQEAERSERVRRAADRVFTRRKGLLARLAEGPGKSEPDTFATAGSCEVRKK